MTRRTWMQTVAATGIVPQHNGGFPEFKQRIFSESNRLRASRDAGALVWSEAIAACAQEQSERKALLKFPGHNDPERGDVAARLNAAGIQWGVCAENLFMEKGYDDPVNIAIVSWWYSPGHRENMVNPFYTLTGVGLVRNADGAYYSTQIFVAPPIRR